MPGLMRVLTAFVALAMSTGTAFAVVGKTTTDVALRRAPTAHAELILNLSQGALVDVGRCLRGWCGVTWNTYAGYVRESELEFLSTPASGPLQFPSFPPFPIERATTQQQTPITPSHPMPLSTRASIAGAIF